MIDDEGNGIDLGLDDPWLLGGFLPFGGSMSGGPERWQEDAAVKAVLTAAMVIDGKRWLSGADFDRISCYYSWKGKAREPRITVEFGHLTFKSSVDPDSLPADEQDLTTALFRRVLDDLDYIASAVDLPGPSIAFEALVAAERSSREAGHGPHLPEPDFYPPVSDYAASDVGSELDALEPNEVLLVLRYRQDDETDGQAFNRRLLQEEALSRLLGAPLASSKCGEAYAIAYPLPPAKAKRSRRKS